MRFNKNDIVFEPGESIDFDIHGDYNCSVISDYLGATPKLIKLAGLSSFEQRLYETDSQLNIYYMHCLYDWCNGELDGARFLQVVVSCDDEQLQADIEESIGSACKTIEISSEEADYLSERVKVHFNSVTADMDYDTFLQQCLDEIEEKKRYIKGA